MTKIASLAPVIRRGEITGTQTAGPPIKPGEQYWTCETCGGRFDIFDLAAVLEHESGECPAGDAVN